MPTFNSPPAEVYNTDMGVILSYYQSPLGLVQVSGTEEDINAVSFVEKPAPQKNKELPENHKQCLHQLHQYFNGTLKKFEVALRPGGTVFQQKVWHELQKIPWGRTITYAELAQRIGDPNAHRAVGMANHNNPIAILIPCHRVIGSDGKLVGYAGGLALKEWLLHHERALPQLSLFDPR